MLFTHPLVFVDIETTGGTPWDRITEVGLIRVEGDSREEYVTLLNPNRRIPGMITDLTGITNEMIIDAPEFYEVAEELLDYMDDAIFVAHNVNFDYGFLRREFNHAGYNWSPQRMCTVRLSRHFYPTQISHRLDVVINTHNFSCLNRHRALDDALVLEQFFYHIQKEFGEERAWKAVGTLTR